jgi:phosphoribosyl 1,2-cyclic phosphodiesterase
VRILFCGVRGSTPSPGPQFVRYGGNTSCIALSHGSESPALVLDAGTGLQQLTPRLEGKAFRGTILLTHLHWDHTHGLPFFSAGDRVDAEVSLLMPAQGDPVDVLERALSPPHFPITPRQLRGRWGFANIEPGQHSIEGFGVQALEIPHKGGRMLGYRVSDGDASLAYICDHSPIALGPGPQGFGAYHPNVCALAEGADLLIHDAQHTAEEFPAVASFGHSAIDYAVGLAESCDVARLLLFHHSPARTDDELDAIEACWQGRRLEVVAAREQTVIDLPPHKPAVSES